MLILFILHLYFIHSLCIPIMNEEKWMVVVSKKRETIKKSRKFDILMKCNVK